MKPSLLLSVSIALFTALGADPARASLDPDTAATTVDAVVRDGRYEFCTEPPHTLSVRARQICPLANEVPGCAALVKACAEKPDDAKPPSAFWQKLARMLVRVSPYVAWSLVAGLLALVVYLIVRAVRAARDDAATIDERSRQDVELLDEAPDPHEVVTAAELLLRRAREHQARGDQRTALFTYLAAALRALDDRGAIRITRDRTHGEYVRACRETTSRDPLREIVREVDQVQFGGDDASADVVLRAATRAEAIVRRVPGPEVRGALAGVTGLLSTVALVILTGACNGAFGSHDDPAGHDLLGDVLTKQGAHVVSLGRSLAALPMTGSSGPAVIVDTDHVLLEDETRAHLVAWVKQGGRLVLAGNPAGWPSELWAKPTQSSGTVVRVETRAASDDEDVPPAAPPRVSRAKLAESAAMTWPSDDPSPRAIARLETGELYAALRDFGDGEILGLASADLLTNLGLVVPGNAAALVALLATLDTNELAIARSEQGVSPPMNPFEGMLKIGLGLALLHALLFIPLLFSAFGTRQVAAKADVPVRRQAFAEHVRAVGALYARRRAAPHALAVFAKHVDERVRAKMPRGSDPAEFLAMRSGAALSETSELYARAMSSKTRENAVGDELQILERLAAIYSRAISQS